MFKDPLEEIMLLKTRVLNLETENKEFQERLRTLEEDLQQRQFEERTSYTKMWDEARFSLDREDK